MIQFKSFADAASPILHGLAELQPVPAVPPLLISDWLAMSLLQKSIRRNQPAFALSAAATLLASDPDKFWRRALCISFEDVGLANTDAIRLALDAHRGKRFRQLHGGDWQVGAKLVLLLCRSKKCRACDDLLIASQFHMDLEDLRKQITGEALSDHLDRIRDTGPLLGRSWAVRLATGSKRGHEYPGDRRYGNPSAVFAALGSSGNDPAMVALAERGFRRVRDVLCANLCLLHPLFPDHCLETEDDYFPAVSMNKRGVPTYALDMFSREGRIALERFLAGRSDTAGWIRSRVATQRRIKFLGHALFRVESGLVRSRVRWPAGDKLRLLADAGFSGMSAEVTLELLQMLRSDLPALDKERVHA